jgi:hypothetical protein
MTKSSYWPIVALSSIAILAIGIAAILGLGHVQGPMAGITAELPSVTLATVVGAGLVDGSNPCAFTVLLLFITALLATVQAAPEVLARFARV